MSGTPKHKGVEIQLDGKPYIVPPLSLGAIEDLQPEIEAAGARPSAKLVIDLLHRALQRNYPSITREQVREGIDIGAMLEVFGAVLGVSGFTAQAEAGNLKATAPGTGAPSMPISAPVSAGPGSTAEST